MFTINI